MQRVCVLLLALLLLLQLQLSYGDDGAAVERFKQYLQIRSDQPKPDYKATTQFLLSVASDIGLQSKVIEPIAGKPIVLLSWIGSSPQLPSILLNSHVDVVPAEPDKWHNKSPFGALQDEQGNIFARGSQDMKCVGMQYLEAIRNLKSSGFVPLRSIHVSFVPDEEIGGADGAGKFVESAEFRQLGVGVAIDEGLASESDELRVFYAERTPWWLIIKAEGRPGHGSKLYDNSAMENMLKSLEAVSRFRASQFDLVKAGLAAEGEVTSVNPVFLKGGAQTPTGYVMNIQPSEAEAGFDIRMSPFADGDDMRRRIEVEWAPASRNMTFRFKQQGVIDRIFTPVDDSNPWWLSLKNGIAKSGSKLSKPEIFAAATDARFFRSKGIPAFGFSPMANTPILLHDHNEFLSTKEYLNGIKVYEQLLISLASLQDEKSASHSEL